MPSTDATKNILGFTFQKLMALEKCFNAPVNTSVWMEYFGDISNGLTTTEVKHHFGEHNLSSNSKDFWKTLYNLINDRELLSHHNEFNLLTTSKIPENSIFLGWNKKTAPQKFKVIKDHAPTAGVQTYHSTVTSNSAVAKGILDKFSIISEQPKVEEKWKLLQDHAMLNFAEDGLKESALTQALGLLEKYAIETPDKWEIDINTFREDLRAATSKYAPGRLPFPQVEIQPIDPDIMNYRFVEKLSAINLKPSKREDAIQDYIRAKLSQIKIINQRSILEKELTSYDKDILSMMGDEKDYYEDNFNSSNKDQEKESRNLYSACMRKSHDDIPGVSDTKKYYRDGRIHHNVEHSNFDWKINTQNDER